MARNWGRRYPPFASEKKKKRKETGEGAPAARVDGNNRRWNSNKIKKRATKKDIGPIQLGIDSIFRIISPPNNKG